MNLIQAIGRIQDALIAERVMRDRVIYGAKRERKLAEIDGALAALDYIRQRLGDVFPDEVPRQLELEET